MLAWAHDPTRPNHAFGLVNPRTQAIRLPTNCGTRVNGETLDALRSDEALMDAIRAANPDKHTAP